MAYLRLEIEKSHRIVDCLCLTACKSHALLLRRIVTDAPCMHIYVGFVDEHGTIDFPVKMGYIAAFELDTRWETILKYNPDIKVSP